MYTFKHLALLLCILLTIIVAGCAGSAGREPVTTAALPYTAAPNTAVGDRLFRGLCRPCHGQDGRADTPLARELDPRPADLTRGSFKYRSTPSGSLPTDRDLMRTLHVGIPGSAMPALADVVSLSALWALAAKIKDLSPRFKEERPDPALPLAEAPPRDSASTARGAQIYGAQGCAGCHGSAGEGDGPAASQLKDNQGRPLLPRDHTRGIFRSGFTRKDLFRAISTGLDGTPMPALPDDLSAAARWDLVDHLVSLSAGRSRLWRYLERGPSWVDHALVKEIP